MNLTLRTGVTILGIWLCLASAFGQTDPDWLYTPPQHPDYIYGVGISPLYRSDSLSYRNARLRGIEDLAKQAEVQIVSKRAEARTAGKTLSYGYTLEVVDSLIYQKCMACAVSLDSLMTDHYAFVLIGVPRELEPDRVPIPFIRENLRKRRNRRPPAWIHTLPTKKNWIYGVGISQAYRRENEAWENSAKQARREIALTVQAKRSYLEDESVSDRGTRYKKWSEATTTLTLSHNRIQHRWYDAKNGLYYTLIAFPLSDANP